jgi:hypothetical protein
MEASSQLHAPTALFPGKKSSGSTEYVAKWATRRSGGFGAEKLLPLPGFKPYVINPYNYCPICFYRTVARLGDTCP